MSRLATFGADTFRSLHSRNFRLFLAGQGIVQVGMWMQLVAIAYVMLDLTDSGVMLGLTSAAHFGPVLVLGAWSGVLADRVDRHRLLTRLTAAGAVVAAAFAALVLSGHAQVWSVMLLAFATGVITALENPARRAFVSDLVGSGDITNAVGLNSALMTGARVVGPAVAGFLVAGPGVGWAFAINAVSFGPKLWLFVRMDRTEFQASERLVKGRGQLRAGLRYVWATPELRLPIVLITVVGTLAWNHQVVLPLFAERDLVGGASTFAMLFSAMSVGSVVGALVMARRADADARFLAHSALALGATTVAFAAAPTLPLALGLALPMGAMGVFVVSGASAVVQLRAAPAMRGRVLALISVVFLGSTPVGGPIVGWVSEAFGARWGLGLGAAASAGAAIWTLWSLRRIERTVPDRSAAGASLG